VTLGFDVGPDGRAVNPGIVAANPPGLFDAAAVQAVKAWYFERVDGKAPVQAEGHPHVTVSVQFAPPPPVTQTGQ
jgi:TonB family protein